MFLSHCEGNRTIDDALLLFANIESKRALNSHIPVFTSDNWDSFETALIQTYGIVEQPLYKGRGRPPLPVWVPFENLMYAQVCKKRENGRIIEVVQKVVLGDKDEVLKRLGVDKNGCINTSYVERFHLTIRNSMARFVRKGMNFSKNQEIHTCALNLFQALLY